MSQVLLSRFQGHLDLLNFVLQLPVCLCGCVRFGFDPLVFMLKPRSLSPLLNELELEGVDSRGWCRAASATVNELDILVCCLSESRKYTGTAPLKDLPQDERHVSGDGEREQDGIPHVSHSSCVKLSLFPSRLWHSSPCIQEKVWRTPFSFIKWSTSCRGIF
jgi:hypothetical protein